MPAPYDHITSYPSTTDVGVYAQYTSLTTGEVWNGSAMEAWDDANVDEYDVPAEFFSGGRYGSHVPSALPKDDYFVRFFKRSAVDAPATLSDLKLPDEWSFRWNGTTLSSTQPGAAAWYYDAEEGVALAMGETDLDIDSDLEATNTRNHAVIQADGEASDAIVNGILAAAEIETVPVIQADVKDYIWKLLQLGSRYITAGLLIGHRAWYGLDSTPPDKLSGWATAFENKGRQFVNDAIAALEGTAGSDTEEESVVAVQAIVPTREQGCGYPWGWAQ